MVTVANHRQRLLVDADETEDYVDLLAYSIEQACLNDYYPAVGPVVRSLDMMLPSVHRGLHPELQLHADTGLPTYKEFVRVLTDWRTAREEIPKIEKWKDRDGKGIEGKLARKYRYYETLSKLGAVHGEAQRIFFRKLDNASALALFRVVLDRITPQGYLERLTVEMGQRSELWGRRELTVNDVAAVEMSENLKGIVYRMASHDSDVIFINLNEQEGLSVTTVIKGRVGPFISNGSEVDPLYAPLRPCSGEGGLLTLSLHVADVEQLTDVFNDPFRQKATFSAEARGELASEGGKNLFHVMTDRKFVLTDGDRGALERFLDGAGTKNLIYRTEA